MTQRSLIAVLALGYADSAGARERWLFTKRPAPTRRTLLARFRD